MVWRYLLAFILSLAVIFLWQAMQPPPPPRPAPGAGAGQPQAGLPQQAAQPAPGGEKEKEKPEAVRFDREHKEVKLRLLEDRFECVADSKGGGCLAAVLLPEYHETVKSLDPYQLLFPPPGDRAGTFGLSVEDPKLNVNLLIPWGENWKLEESRAADGMPIAVFENSVGSVTVRKQVLPGVGADAPVEADPGPGSLRHLQLRVEFTNTGNDPQEVKYRVYGPTAIDTESFQSPGSDIQVLRGRWSDGQTVRVELAQASSLPGDRWDSSSDIAWVGLQNNYFASILFPIVRDGPRARFIENGFSEAYPDWQTVTKLALETHKKKPEELSADELKALSDKAYKNAAVGLRAKISVKPGETVVHEYGLYLGPRESGMLARYDRVKVAGVEYRLDFSGVNHYGWYSFIVKLFIWLLDFLKGVAFQSWGLAIILLTLVVRICLHPINKKSQASMTRFQKKMQKIKPEMDEIKTRFADNRLKMNQEIQKLWKKHGINPGQQMAGCLMLLLQLPIWFGLYATLIYAFGLRQASFLWIEDLTRPDKLFAFGTAVPLVGEHFNLLPILYVILTIVNQRLQPRPEDPQMLTQYRMMTFMLVLFGYIFYSSPAGFMLYIMTSSGLGIIESKIIKAELAREESSVGGASPSPKAGAPVPLYPSRPKQAEDGRDRQKSKRPW